MYWIWGMARHGPKKGEWVQCVCFDELKMAIAYAKQRVGEMGGKLIIKDANSGEIIKTILEILE